MLDHVSDLKLQHLVELSKLGDGCADLESEIDAWLAANDVVFDGHTIPFVLMPHFVSPGQVRRVRRASARSASASATRRAFSMRLRGTSW